ncbi:nuclear transport factor 2 [Parasitella parasitica]|nr:nuclear transport factor 2 [Parasitella parasitica]
MATIEAIAANFTRYYYHTFDTARANLASTYRDDSKLSFEGQCFEGAQNITEKLMSLSFQKVQHHCDTVDVQPLDPTNAKILIVVVGKLLIDDNENPLNFSQVFQLVAQDNTFYISNDVFRFIY